MILIGKEATDKLKAGIDLLANAVKSTLGPKGRNVIIYKNGDLNTDPHVTKDGVTVAKHIWSSDNMINMAVEMIRQAAEKTGDVAGDGTTTATVLVQAIVEIGMKHLNSGSNPVDLKRGVDKAVKLLTAEILKRSVSIGNERIEEIATISANNDPFIGKLVADAIKKVTLDGSVTVAEGKANYTFVEYIMGMHYDEGYTSQYFVNNQDDMTVTYDDCLVLVTKDRVTSITQVQDALDYSKINETPLLIIADDYDVTAHDSIVYNRQRSNIPVVLVRAPGYDTVRATQLSDIALRTGATLMNTDNGYPLDSLDIEKHLGEAQKVIVTNETTVILGGCGSDELITTRINNLKAEIDKQLHDYDRQKLEERIGKLTGGISVIFVGANSESEVKEIKDRVDDALCATRAALEMGIVAGGGETLIRCAEVVKKKRNRFDNEDQRIGFNMVLEACDVPLITIIDNAGLPSQVILNEVKQGELGYNAVTNNYENLLESGVIDPTKVAITSLENAGSISGMILMSNCMIYPRT